LPSTGDAENAVVETSARFCRGGKCRSGKIGTVQQRWKIREWKHRENVWVTKATDSLCPQVDTNTDTDDADEMEDVSAAAAAAAAPTAVDDNSAAAGSPAAATPDATCSGRQLPPSTLLQCFDTVGWVI